MLFNSYIFVLLFLPVCMLGYYGLNYCRKYTYSQIFLLGMSLWFYAYFNINYLVVILISILINYLSYHIIRNSAKKAVQKISVAGSLLFNLGLLIYFKYMDFFIENINKLFNKDYMPLNMLLPLGISFFTFQQISFIMDAYKGEIPNCSILHYASFITFFPQLIAGPIITHDELIPQFLDSSKKRINWDNIAKGIYIFTLGLAKKVLLADTFGNAVSWGYSNMNSLDSTNALIIMLSYTFQIYFDFSGYCDMAIGIAKLFNIDLPVNFNSPYKALTITEFWDRWHITLTRFFTKYVYIPLGGNRCGIIRTYINILIVFVISGFWHGASWNFIFWGCCHGIFSVATRHFKDFFEKLHPALSWLITFSFINILWVFFRADSLGGALELLNKISVCNFGEINSEIASCFNLIEFDFLLKRTQIPLKYPFFLFSIFILFSFIVILGSKNAYEKTKKFKPSIANSVLSAFLLLWCVFSFSGISTFLYFNF